MKIFDDENDINKDILSDVKNMFFNTQPVSVIVKQAGQSLDENNNYVLGCAAGPSIHTSHLFHEMGHLAEREPEKLLLKPYTGWGYTYGKFWQIGSQSGWESSTDQSVQREKRVWAYQLSLENHFNSHYFDERDENKDVAFNIVSSVRYMDAFFFYKNRVINKEHRNQLGYNGSELEAIKILAEEVKFLSQTKFTFDNFCEEWFKRMELLKAS